MFYMLLTCVILRTVCYGEMTVVPSIRRQYGKHVPNHVIKSIHPTSLFTCAELCLSMKVCVSLNFVKDKSTCELNFNGVPRKNDSSVFVTKEDIPKEYGNECGDHSCSIYEMCSIDRNKSTICLPLNIECGEAEKFPRTVSFATGSKMKDIIEYICEIGTMPVYTSKGSSRPVKWKIDKFIYYCNPNGLWLGPTFVCTDCFDNPRNKTVNISETLTQRKCRNWKEVGYPELQNAIANISEADHVCRSPLTGNHYERPYLWCLTDDPEMVFDICPIPRCYDKEPYSSNQRPPSVNYTREYHFADVPIALFKCKDVTKVTRPYCPVSRYENDQWSPIELSCSVVDCYRSSTAYRGKITCTVTGRTCQNWNSQFPHAHDYVLDPVDHDSNYCRNPDGNTGVPWCLTNDPLVRYEYCWIPNCT